MSLLLHIDTALTTAAIFLSDNGRQLAYETNNSQNDHASWIQPAIQRLLNNAGVKAVDLKAVAVVAGPGSYTGLRVGMATAKGICYALNLPLITIDTLFLMANGAKLAMNGDDLPVNGLLCPMIDARRMEVFTALYNPQLGVYMDAQAMILDADSFATQLSEHSILFFGNGSDKWKQVCQHVNARFISFSYQPAALINTTYSKFLLREFTALAYAEPVYIKEFYIHPKK